MGALFIFTGSHSVKTNPVQTVAPAMVDGLSNIDATLDAYLQANGGAVSLNRLHVVQITGTYTEGNNSSNVELLMHVPVPSQISVGDSNGQLVTYTRSEGQIWMNRFDEMNRLHEVAEVTEREAGHLTALGQFPDPLMRVALRDEGTITELVSQSRFYGNSAIRLRVAIEPHGNIHDYFLNPDTMAVLGRRDLTRKGEMIREFAFLEYRKIQELNQPFRILTRVDGQQVSELNITNVTFNKPDFPSYYTSDQSGSGNRLVSFTPAR